MSKRFLATFAIALAFASALVMKASWAQAQDRTYYTYVSSWTVPRSQWAAFEKERDQSNAAMQRLVADDTIVAWANDDNMVHQEDGYTHQDWFVSTSRAGILKALDVLRSTATGPAFASVTRHGDKFLHTVAHGGKTFSGGTAYLRVAMWHTKPGMADDFVQHFTKYIKPILDSDVASGSILMYNFDTEELHTEEPGGYYLAILYPSAEAMDTFYTRLEASSKENPAVGQVIASLTVAASHRDLLDKTTSYQHK